MVKEAKEPSEIGGQGKTAARGQVLRKQVLKVALGLSETLLARGSTSSVAGTSVPQSNRWQ